MQGFLRRGARVVGVAASDRLTGARLEVRARVVVNAAGPFAEQLYVRAGFRPERRIPLSRDMALVVRRPLVRERALAVQTRYRDPDAVLSRGYRHLFAVPWRGVTLVGVNSVVYDGDPNCLAVTEPEVHAVRSEMAETLADVVFRRTDLGTGGNPGDEALETCAVIMGTELGWDRARRELELAEVRARFPGTDGPGRLAV